MARTSTNNIISFAIVLLLTAHAAFAQAPEIPSSVSFGGITVKFDRSAQDIIEEDVKSLMSNRKFWEEKMDRAIMHFPIVEGILMDEEVPIDFKYLAVQESSFRPDVVSSSNAVGYWQFKPETARELNLRVDNDVDERKNISSSTHAAAWYLKKNNQQFNNWVTTLYSYYQGAGGVKKVVPANWAYAREVTLTGKTDRYMLRFFAHKIALESGIERYKSPNAYILMESDYGKGQSLDEIARSLNVPASELKNHNRWLNDDKIPDDREYLITLPVPVDQVASVREKLALPPRQTAVASVYEDTGYPVLKKSAVQLQEPNSPTLYEINGLPGIEARAGDKPKTLAKAAGIRTPRFMRYNDLLADMPLVPGQVYYLSRKHKKASAPSHVARPGDTWLSVSQQYGIRLVNLLKFNRTTSRNYPIQTGQVLFLNKKRPRKQPIEIIAPPQPTAPAKKDSILAAAGTSVVPQKAPASATTAPAASNNNIPSNASGRKKYTPVLVEKNESVAAKEPEPAAAPASTAASAGKTAGNAAGLYKPSGKTSGAGASAPAAANTNDRVVIITQDDTNSTFKSAEDEKPASKSNTPGKVVTPNTTRTTASSSSVYSRMRAERAAEGESEAPAKKESEPARWSNSEEKNTATASAAPAYHTVQPGDTYFGIASKYNLSLRELLTINNRSAQSRLVSGQRLLVSKTGEEAAPAKVAVERPAPASTFKTPEEIKEETRLTATPGSEFHTVQSGQTYYSISKAYGISIKELLDLNNLSDSDRLKSGQKLRVKRGEGGESEAASQPSGSQTHTVAPGETLFRIAQTYHTSVDDIKKLNNMSGNSVMVGQKLKIPQQ
ncbi:membrane-bound lytic murein transglycosylase D [Dyadobacter sp. BE34]|uniref:Membrane-bound lytic murein transglycosylase D n=1 Tax=Dyadobacter fermentans TaxID=94254 RepID=A0ABU1R3S0_9BACT|nr:MULTISPECIES: LysM peptidoglycan-binding domain-containing protein [Dyadobacter]MDR6808056.1 membrane-bound lytic murein transglycosylase D [Dyadobacter fermentans]MDR7046128.1 membrane-bound lytic murein transglycosylase D [Dyadobacter sp. BE242]MDR7200441.1 membrane-bound lytic murein transglycosylase D [Dyadobacter sp. BE34]MDR7218401.1 membrane-bound lytic murein transglycosylase D [Dyadobacter sp. BE31]MDR7266332.1 membrane-bound lytic murein transglycosylase D [Dyadobacter sp. BE32]